MVVTYLDSLDIVKLAVSEPESDILRALSDVTAVERSGLSVGGGLGDRTVLRQDVEVRSRIPVPVESEYLIPRPPAGQHPYQLVAIGADRGAHRLVSQLVLLAVVRQHERRRTELTDPVFEAERVAGQGQRQRRLAGARESESAERISVSCTTRSLTRMNPI